MASTRNVNIFSIAKYTYYILHIHIDYGHVFILSVVEKKNNNNYDNNK